MSVTADIVSGQSQSAASFLNRSREAAANAWQAQRGAIRLRRSITTSAKTGQAQIGLYRPLVINITSKQAQTCTLGLQRILIRGDVIEVRNISSQVIFTTDKRYLKNIPSNQPGGDFLFTRHEPCMVPFDDGVATGGFPIQLDRRWTSQTFRIRGDDARVAMSACYVSREVRPGTSVVGPYRTVYFGLMGSFSYRGVVVPIHHHVMRVESSLFHLASGSASAITGLAFNVPANTTVTATMNVRSVDGAGSPFIFQALRVFVSYPKAFQKISFTA